MRSHSTIVVLVAIAAISYSIPTPIAHGQTAEEIIDEVFNLFNNSSNSNNSNNSNANSNQGSGSRSRMYANAMDTVDPNTGYRSDSFPPGTRVKINGPNTSTQYFNLPASLMVLPDGSIGQLGAAVSGNYVILDNRSNNSVELEFIPPGGTTMTPAPRPQVPPNNRSSSGTGDVEAKNVSGVQVTVRYTLPTGKYYSYNNRNNSSLYAHVANGRVDETPGIAENTRVTVDNYVEEFYVPRGSKLMLTIHNNYIASQVVPIPIPTAPTPNPSPTPGSNPAPGPNPAPNSGSNPLPIAGITKNTIPVTQTTPLTSAVAQSLASDVTNQVRHILEDFDRASMARIAAIKTELIAVNYPDPDSLALAAADGEPMAVKDVADQYKAANRNAQVSVDLLHTIATFREQFTDLLAKFKAGKPTAEMSAIFQAIKDQGTNLGAAGLADAMTLAQQELLIRDTINRAVPSSVLSVGNPSLPVGSVTVIRHPGVATPTNYLGEGGLILTRSSKNEIVVAKSAAADALGLPTTSDTPLPESPTTSVLRGIIITNPSSNPELAYTLNRKSFRIKPGQTIAEAPSTNAEIEFSPGPNSPNKRYSLGTEGTYSFIVKDGLWDLASKEFHVQLHNPASGNTRLNYLVDGASSTLDPGSTAEHTSKSLMLIQFDRGNGSSTATKLLQENGDYYFSLSQDSKWDLFAGNVPVSQDAGTSQVTIARPPLASLRQAAGSKLFDFTTAAAAPTGGNNLLDLLKATQ
ncbi:MAG: hypothetical protein H6822_05015 [Planctomycetaceae bacterium]|nr:hypothetical protein [Planctomycetales bacterium]MCB9921517.1 hypothetical protein [Planctomycetaceae bacterium]